MSKSVIIDAVRSPIGVKNGNMVGIRPDDLAAQVVKGLLARNSSINPGKIEDLILGCAFPEGPQVMHSSYYFLPSKTPFGKGNS